MTDNLIQMQEGVLKELDEEKKALIREAVLMRIEKRREAERARKNKEYTQEQLEADEYALKAVRRRLRRHNKQTRKNPSQIQNPDR